SAAILRGRAEPSPTTKSAAAKETPLGHNLPRGCGGALAGESAMPLKRGGFLPRRLFVVSLLGFLRMPATAGLQKSNRRIDDLAFGIDAQALGGCSRAPSSDLTRIVIDQRAREVALGLWRRRRKR